MNAFTEILERAKAAISDAIGAVRIFILEKLASAKSAISGLSESFSNKMPGNFSGGSNAQAQAPASSPNGTQTPQAQGTAKTDATMPAERSKTSTPNFFKKSEPSIGMPGNAFSKKIPGSVTVVLDRPLGTLAGKKTQILLGTGVFMILSAMYLFFNLAYVFSEQRSVLQSQEQSLTDGESLLAKLKAFDVGTLSQADLEKNADLDTFLYNQNAYLSAINRIRGETVRYGTVKWDEKAGSFSEMNFVDLSKYATIDDLLTTLVFWKAWFKAETLEITNAYDKERGTPYFMVKTSGKLVK